LQYEEEQDIIVESITRLSPSACSSAVLYIRCSFS